jgi:hypothetical protein
MAKTEVGASVNVEFKSVGEMRKAIKDATSDLIVMQEQFGKTSPQAIEAARRIADLKDRINDAREQADLFDPGNKFKAFSNAASQVAAGFSAVQGAMALVGEESDDLQKTLVKVQGAMALSQGLSQIADLGKAYEELKIVAVNAFRAIKTAIGSTGIGLLVIALGAIVAYWDDIKGAVSGVSQEQKKLNKASEDNLKAQKGKLDAISKQENTLKLQGKSEKDILKSKIDQTNQTIKAAEINLKNSIQTQKSQVAAAKRNKEILEGLIAFVSLPLTAVLKGIDLIGQAVGKNFDLYGKFTGGLAGLVFDPEQTKKDGDASIKAQEDALTELKNQRDGFILSSRDIDKKGEEERNKAVQEADDKAAKAREEAEKILFESRKALMSQRDAELLDLETKRVEEEKRLIAAGVKDRSAFDEAYRLKRKEINDKFDKQEDDKKAADVKKEKDFQDQLNKIILETRLAGIQDETQKEIEQLNIKYAEQRASILANENLTEEQRLALLKALKEKEAQELGAIDEKRKTQKEQINAQILQAEIQLQDATFAATSAGLSALETLAGKNKKLANAFFVIDKALAIVKIIMDTQREIASYYAAGAASPMNLIVPGSGMALATKQAIAAKIRAAGSIATIAATSIGRFMNGSGGGGTGPTPPPPPGNMNAPMSPTLSPVVQGQALNSMAINNLGNQSLRAYVMNSDIQNNNQRNAYLERNARIG